MDAQDDWTWPDELAELAAAARGDPAELDDWPPEQLTAWCDDVAAAEAGPETAETAWRALRLLEQEESGRGGWDLVEAAYGAAGGDDLARMSDAEIIGRAVKCRELLARAQGRMFRTLEELLRRRPPAKRYRRGEDVQERRDEHDGVAAEEGAPNPPRVPVMASREAASEVALAFTSTEYAAERLVEQTADLSRRLPVAFAELEAGRTYPDRVLILCEGTSDLSDEDAGQVDAMLSAQSGRLTTGELRDALRRAVIRIDPAAADRRRKRNEKKSRVRLYANADHTATLAIEQAPAGLAAAAKARVNALARAAKTAGAAEPADLLGSKIALGLLLGTLPLIPPPLPPDEAGGSPGDAGPPADGGPGNWGGSPATEPDESMPWPAIPDAADAAAPGCAWLPAWLRPNDQGRARLMLPWRTMAGMASEPGELSWFGTVTPGQARDFARAAAADPAVRWTVIVTDDDGHATTVTTLKNRRATKTPGLLEEVTVTIAASLAAGPGSDDAMRRWTACLLTGVRNADGPALADVLARTLRAARAAIADADRRVVLDERAGGCAHTLEVTTYRAPGTMRRWLNARDGTCRNPVCRRRASQCDQDHTVAYDKGGRTCTCNLGALCRLHHQVKQLRGWRLSQDSSGCFTWTTPAGLTYRKEPHRHLV
ncbi:MAG TPA: hypothetical protein VG164_00825 [Trebonia sp.]|nr:hypothetical protein [Trebonia sp.]